MVAYIASYGTRMIRLFVPDRRGELTDIIRGPESLPAIIKSAEPYFGAVIGPCANRIAGTSFLLKGKTYTLSENEGTNCLHSGAAGWHQKYWEAVPQGPSKIYFLLDTDDSQYGFPGHFKIIVSYEITDKNELLISFNGHTKRKGILNMTHHNFYNLNGGGMGVIDRHLLQILASEILAIDTRGVPTGVKMEVADTPFDFREAQPIGARLNDRHTQLHYGQGYDHNYILKTRSDSRLLLAARAIGDQSGIAMEVWTTQTGLHFYSGNFMQGKNLVKGGIYYEYRTAFCLEAQGNPDAIHHPHFPSVELDPSDVYSLRILHKFSLEC